MGFCMIRDFPKKIFIHEEGPREGFQFEKGQIATAAKIELIEALAETGLDEVECVSFVDPRRVPGMVDADDVARGIRRKEGVRYSGVWLNMRGLERAKASGLDLSGILQIYASETFGLRNANVDTEKLIAEQRRWLAFYKANGVHLDSAIVMTAFGCNFEGRIAAERVVECMQRLIDLMDEHGVAADRFRLADTVGWANPVAIQHVVGAVRERWPDLRLALHLHDTRGTGLANALAGLSMGIDSFDSSCGGLGGCPFAGHKDAAGNICTEDFVFMCEEMGIATGLDLDRLIECGRLAERVVGHRLPGKLMHGGRLTASRP